MSEKHVGSEFPPESKNLPFPPQYPQGGPSQQIMGDQPIYVVQTPQIPQDIHQTQPNYVQLQGMDQSRGLPPQPQVQQTPQSPPPGYVQPQQPIYEHVQYNTQPGVTYMPYQPQVQPQQIHVVTHMDNAPGATPHITVHVPTRVTCPNCHNEVVTVVTESPGSTAYILAAVLCCVFWPLMWLPCVISGCLDKTHSCPVCRSVLAHIRA